MIRPWNCKTEPVRSQSLLFPPRQRTFYWKLQHFALRLSTQISPNTVPDKKSDTPTSPNAAPATKSHTPRSPNSAPATKSGTPTSPNTAPATLNDSHILSWLMPVTYETSFTMRGATVLTLQRLQILPLPRKMPLMSEVRHIWNVIYNARSNRHHPPTSPNAAPAT